MGNSELCGVIMKSEQSLIAEVMHKWELDSMNNVLKSRSILYMGTNMFEVKSYP